MAIAQARVSMPAEAKRGEVLEIKTLIRHPMETGYRVDREGRKIPRNIIERFVVTYNGEEIFRLDMTQGIAANPFIAVSTCARESGELVFTWRDQDGTEITVRKPLTVTDP